MKNGNVIKLNLLHLNSCHFNGTEKVQKGSAGGGSIVIPPPTEPDIPPTYTLSASVTNGKVTAKRNGSAVNLPFTANEGDVIVVEVTPNDGYSFEGWADGNTDNPRSITMTADVVLSAQCVEVVQPPVGNYIQFEDAEVERVLMSKGVSSDGVGITIEDAENVTSISAWFKNNTAITSFDELILFKNVTSLSGDAFYGCTNLRTIDLSNIIDFVSTRQFRGCTNLVGDINGDFTMMPSQAFYGTAINSVILPYVTSIGAAAFQSCTSLKSVMLGDKLTEINTDAFYQCSALESFIIRAVVPPTLSNARGIGGSYPIYVPDASLEAYKTALNWVSYADRIHPLSEIEGSLVFYDKLVGDGTAYINTEYYPTSWDNVEWDADAPSVYNKYIFGCKSSVLSVANLVYSASQTYYNYKPSTSATTINEDNAKRQRRTLRISDNGDGSYRREVADLDSGVVNVIQANWGGSDVVATNALRVFCSTTSAGANEKFYKGAIRSLVITDAKTGNTIMSLKPCTYYGEAGMWDEVNGKFYGNAATSGEFSVAND